MPVFNGALKLVNSATVRLSLNPFASLKTLLESGEAHMEGDDFHVFDSRRFRLGASYRFDRGLERTLEQLPASVASTRQLPDRMQVPIVVGVAVCFGLELRTGGERVLTDISACPELRLGHTISVAQVPMTPRSLLALRPSSEEPDMTLCVNVLEFASDCDLDVTADEVYGTFCFAGICKRTRTKARGWWSSKVDIADELCFDFAKAWRGENLSVMFAESDPVFDDFYTQKMWLQLRENSGYHKVGLPRVCSGSYAWTSFRWRFKELSPPPRGPRPACEGSCRADSDCSKVGPDLACRELHGCGVCVEAAVLTVAQQTDGNQQCQGELRLSLGLHAAFGGLSFYYNFAGLAVSLPLLEAWTSPSAVLLNWKVAVCSTLEIEAAEAEARKAEEERAAAEEETQAAALQARADQLDALAGAAVDTFESAASRVAAVAGTFLEGAARAAMESAREARDEAVESAQDALAIAREALEQASSLRSQAVAAAEEAARKAASVAAARVPTIPATDIPSPPSECLEAASLGDLARCSGLSSFALPWAAQDAVLALARITDRCADNESYADPEFNATCSQWDGLDCQPSVNWTGPTYTNSLRCACPVACSTCDFKAELEALLGRCDPRPPPDDCADDASYADPEWNTTCADWDGHVCRPSAAWFGEGYGHELRCACPVACSVCSLRENCTASTTATSSKATVASTTATSSTATGTSTTTTTSVRNQIVAVSAAHSRAALGLVLTLVARMVLGTL